MPSGQVRCSLEFVKRYKAKLNMSLSTSRPESAHGLCEAQSPGSGLAFLKAYGGSVLVRPLVLLTGGEL